MGSLHFDSLYRGKGQGRTPVLALEFALWSRRCLAMPMPALLPGAARSIVAT